MLQNKISVVIIAFNEEMQIGNCIKSVAQIADEIIVVDSFSTDRTVEICENMGATVIQHVFEGHIQQKNWAKDCANFNWVLSLDADEVLSQELIQSIQNFKSDILSSNIPQNKKIGGCSMNRLNHLSKRPIKGCGWYPDTKLRLWHRNWGKWTGVNPHDRFELSNDVEIIHLAGDILHYTYENKKAVWKQALKFGNIGAKSLNNEYLVKVIFKFLSSPILKFIKNYIIKGGFKYGIDGFFICFCQFVESFVKYGKGLILNLYKVF